VYPGKLRDFELFSNSWQIRRTQPDGWALRVRDFGVVCELWQFSVSQPVFLQPYPAGARRWVLGVWMDLNFTDVLELRIDTKQARESLAELSASVVLILILY